MTRFDKFPTHGVQNEQNRRIIIATIGPAIFGEKETTGRFTSTVTFSIRMPNIYSCVVALDTNMSNLKHPTQKPPNKRCIRVYQVKSPKVFPV